MGGLHLCLERKQTNCMTIQYHGACNLLFLIFLLSSHSFET